MIDLTKLPPDDAERIEVGKAHQGTEITFFDFRIVIGVSAVE